MDTSFYSFFGEGGGRGEPLREVRMFAFSGNENNSIGIFFPSHRYHAHIRIHYTSTAPNINVAE